MKGLGFFRALGVSWVVVVLPAGAAAFAGCSEDDAPVTPVNDAAPPTPDANGGPSDAGSDAPARLDCTTDLDEDTLPRHLECTGLYESFLEKKTGSDAKPFTPSIEFWSDAAEKHRWVLLPAGAKIDISNWDEWVYPVGMKVWKEFKQGGKRIETRLFTKLPDGWAHAVYRWNADETDAVRKEEGDKVPGIGPDGGIYEVPESTKCEQCHFGRKDRMLGFDAVGLGLATAQGVTLKTLAADNRFAPAPPSQNLALPGSEVAKAAVGWLHMNCGMCHNKNDQAGAAFTRIHFLVHASQLAPVDGGAPSALEALDAYGEGYCVDSTIADEDAGVGVAYKLIRGGAPDKSAVSVLSGRRAAGDPNTSQMPPIITRAVDFAGHKLLDDWITSLPPCP